MVVWFKKIVVSVQGMDWLILFWVQDLTAPIQLGLITGLLCPISVKGALKPHWSSRCPPNWGSLVPQARLQMAPMLNVLLYSGSKKKKPRYICLIEAKASLRLKPEWPPGLKRYSDVLFISLKSPGKTNPLQVPQEEPL